MQEIISEFIDAMAQSGLAPANQSDIRADDKRHDYQLSSDPKSKKKGFYRLKIEGDFGFGFFGDYRNGDHQGWHSKVSHKYTDAERQAFALRAQKAREASEAEQAAVWAARAQEAQDTLLFLNECTSHPYLDKKGVKPYGILELNRNIVIPMSDNNQTWNYQTIQPDGTKLFQKEAKKQGTWFEIPGDGTICLCEGFATGASIHEATGHTVIVAFDAGNLVSVAPKIKNKYPGKTIIVCGDNDQFTTKQDKTPWNPGIEKATQAAIAINAKLIYPEFQDLKDKPTDFNDLRQLEGLESVADRIRQAGAPPSGNLVPKDKGLQTAGGVAGGDWRKELHTDKNGNPYPRSTHNLKLFMRYEESLKGLFRYDSFSKRRIIHRCPPWENDQSFQVRPIADYDYFNLEAYLDCAFGLKVPKNKCAEAVDAAAQLEENEFNPASEYFNNIGNDWDGIPRLDSWLKKHVSDGEQPQEYLSLIGRKIMCGLAARAMHPGVKFDTMVILEGKQYAGKSYLCLIMSTIAGKEYFLDDFKDIDNKDALMKIQGKLVVEFPEMNTMRRSEVNDLKAFLSRTTDVFRPPYGRNTIESGRQCIFMGTINPEGPYLRDVTGNRRYWPVSCREAFDLEAIRNIMPQLHAEAANLIKRGEQIWLTRPEIAIAAKEQQKRVLSDAWLDTISDIVGGRPEITTDQIMTELGIPHERRSPQTQSRVNQTMVSLGFEPAKITIGTKQRRGFVNANKKDKIKW